MRSPHWFLVLEESFRKGPSINDVCRGGNRRVNEAVLTYAIFTMRTGVQGGRVKNLEKFCGRNLWIWMVPRLYYCHIHPAKENVRCIPSLLGPNEPAAFIGFRVMVSSRYLGINRVFWHFSDCSQDQQYWTYPCTGTAPRPAQSITSQHSITYWTSYCCSQGYWESITL